MSHILLRQVDQFKSVRSQNAVQRAVYERDENTCRVCGWQVDRWDSADPRILELHHLDHHVRGGQNVEDNLIVICSRCHDEVHAGGHQEIIERIQNEL